jgi:hypothetical protein
LSPEVLDGPLDFGALVVGSANTDLRRHFSTAERES